MITVWVVLVSYERLSETLSPAKQGTRATYDNARHMNIQNPLPRIVRTMDLHEVGLEVVRNGFIFVRSFAERRDAVKLYLGQVVPGNDERDGRAQFGNSNALI